jgi:hypothetical protein
MDETGGTASNDEVVKARLSHPIIQFKNIIRLILLEGLSAQYLIALITAEYKRQTLVHTMIVYE